MKARVRFATVLRRFFSGGAALDVGALLEQQGGARQALDHLDKQGTPALDSYTLARLLLACGKFKALEEGKRVHRYVITCGFSRDGFLCSHLVHMYLKCGSYEDAEQVFGTMHADTVDVSTLTAVIVARAGLGKWDMVFPQLEQMQAARVWPDRIMFISLLSTCTKLGAVAQGRRILGLLAGTNLEYDIGVLNIAINMFAKCGCLEEAAQAFNKLQTRDVVSWTVMIGAYAQHGLFSAARQLYQGMQLEGVLPNKVTFVSALSACETPYSLKHGRLVHAHVLESGLESHVVVANSLLGMYSRCSSTSDARELFEKMALKDIVSWTTMITAYSQQDCPEALRLYYRMIQEGVHPRTLTFSMVLEACGTLAASKTGRAVHAQLVERGLECDIVGISLVNMYSKCNMVEEARQVFNRLHNRSRILWNSMITAYQDKDPKEALSLFRQMQPEGVSPDRITFMTVLNACTKLLDVEEGRMIQERITASGFSEDVCVATALFNMFARCGSLQEAAQVFEAMKVRDVISWNNIIIAYVEHQQGKVAIRLCRQMQHDGMKPNKSTFAGLLNGCAIADCLVDGRQIHSWILESGLQGDIVMVTALITMYSNCGSLGDARKMFDRVLMESRRHHKDLILWTSMITAYEQHGEFRRALELYEQMHARAVEADRVTFISVLNACAHLADLRQGRAIHARVIRSGFSMDATVANSIIFMYGKCGSFEEAGVVFDKVEPKDVTLWTCMMSAYAQLGHGEQARDIFRHMRQDGCELTDLTFVAILSACSHSGLVETGCEFFASMSEHSIELTPELYGCMVDLLARAGHLQQAEDFIAKMSIPVNCVVLTTLLAACRIHGDIDRARRVAEKLEALDPHNDAPFVTLSNIEMH